MYKTLNLVASMCLVAIGLSACGGGEDQTGVAIPETPQEVNNDCFWQGPYVIDNPKTNFAFPDTGSTYWSAKYTLPEGASLRLKGDFPYARYMSINSYREDTTPAYTISDSKIIPDQNNLNPFIDGNARNNPRRAYTLNITAGEVPETGGTANTIYDATKSGNSALLVYRVYVADKGKSLMGGVKLPQVELTTRQGQVLTGEAACSALKASSEIVSIPLLSADTYAKARLNNPAQQVPVWRASYSMLHSVQCDFYGVCDTDPVRSVGYYANLDNQYISTFVDRNIKPIVVIRGKIPSVPKTYNAEQIFNTKNSQLRYWSICQNEFYSQKVTSCLFDEQIDTNARGEFTIVTSLLEDRPKNATKECGVGYLKWSDQGDGFSIVKGREDHKTDGRLIIRNMLPASNFYNAIQNTQKPGDEAQVLGEYLPKAEYYTKQEFEALGCNPSHKM